MFYHCDVMIACLPLHFCHALCIKITLFQNFAMAVCWVAVTALGSYALGSEFKARRSRYFFLIEIKSHCISFSRVRAASGISSEWLRISDKPAKIA